MSTPTILTLCETCRRQYEEGFIVKPYPGRPTTEKKEKCEECKKRFGAGILRQYLVTAKGGKK